MRTKNYRRTKNYGGELRGQIKERFEPWEKKVKKVKKGKFHKHFIKNYGDDFLVVVGDLVEDFWWTTQNRKKKVKMVFFL